MTCTGHEPIISGCMYRVTEAANRSPSDMAEFVGNTDLLLQTEGHEHRAFGVGVYASDGVRFYEKDLENEGKDIRIWSISPSPDGGFTAEHAAAI